MSNKKFAAKVTFNNTNRVFFQSLKNSVEAYFLNNKLKKTGNWRMYSKAIILIPSALAVYIILLTVSMPAVVGILLCALMGLLLGSIGFNVMHDACHGSYSSKKWVNETLGLTLNAIGGNAFFWKQKHNILHHTYTNIAGIDDDIAQSKFLRQNPSQPWMPVHKYQHIYLTLAYSLSLFMWVGLRDFEKYFTRRIHNSPVQPMSTKEHVTFWASKILYPFFYIILPILSVGWLPWLIGYITMGVVTGIFIAYVFQLAHAVEGPEFESVGLDDKLIEAEWAVHQIKTTANFAPKNKIVSWLVGGLNYQVEHHLFPRVCHIHYPALSKIVSEHCQRFGLPYHSFPTVTHAIVSHVRTMKKLGNKEYSA
ncbi:MAG: acyl-CoA desaturase [Bacteroidota bacterium]